MSIARVAVVITGVIVAGAVMGGIAGAITAALLGVSGGGLSILREPMLFAYGAMFGAPCGAVLAPVAGFTVLRHVPLWRLFAEVTIGAIVGGFAASLANLSLQAIVGAGAIGFSVACARLARRTPRRESIALEQPANP